MSLTIMHGNNIHSVSKRFSERSLYMILSKHIQLFYAPCIHPPRKYTPTFTMYYEPLYYIVDF